MQNIVLPETERASSSVMLVLSAFCLIWEFSLSIERSFESSSILKQKKIIITLKTATEHFPLVCSLIFLRQFNHLKGNEPHFVNGRQSLFPVVR